MAQRGEETCCQPPRVSAHRASLTSKQAGGPAGRWAGTGTGTPRYPGWCVLDQVAGTEKQPQILMLGPQALGIIKETI